MVAVGQIRSRIIPTLVIEEPKWESHHQLIQISEILETLASVFPVEMANHPLNAALTVPQDEISLILER